MSLVARHLEANGIPTVMFGTAKDIVEHCGVPRFVFVDFPLGNSCGRSFDADHQHEVIELGLRVARISCRSSYHGAGAGGVERR